MKKFPPNAENDAPCEPSKNAHTMSKPLASRILEPWTLAETFSGKSSTPKTTPKKKTTTPGAPKKARATKPRRSASALLGSRATRILFASPAPTTPKKARKAPLPKTMFVVLTAAGLPVSIHATEAGANQELWTVLAEDGKRPTIMQVPVVN